MFKISNSIISLSVEDTDIDLFENQYNVPHGISYNSYLIKCEKNILFDTVDSRKKDIWLNNLKSALDKLSLDYLVVSHVEPDHSSTIPDLLKFYPNIKIIGNTKTFSMLEQFYHLNLVDSQKIVVHDLEELQIGSHTFKFFMAPMVHWPEVMMTYDECEKVLFSADAFGKFGVVSSDEQWLDEARRYYFNIVGKYGIQVQSLLKKLSSVDIAIIAPLHGPILKDNLSFYINKYNIWSSYSPEDNGIFIPYATIHGNTKIAVEKFAQILRDSGYKNILLSDLSRSDLSENISNAFRFDKVILAASSYNMGVFPCMENFLRQLISKNYQNRRIGIIENGSWAPSAANTIKEILSKGKNIEIINPIITIKSSMDISNINEMTILAQNLIK